ncbi:UvrB/UvrC motif-containing protein, partial [Candidatus Peregrinibacteria bacterium]|nr:UvrB/UvrC motif-containing protein [Candidatus Peregrinibacteria bacterium]
ESVIRAIKDIAMESSKKDHQTEKKVDYKKIPKSEIGRFIREIEDQMELAAANLEFEKAAELRDEIDAIKEEFGLK